MGLPISLHQQHRTYNSPCPWLNIYNNERRHTAPGNKPPTDRHQPLYLATVIHCCLKKVVGWSIADHMRTALVVDVLRNAAATTTIEAAAIWHSDRSRVFTPRPSSRLRWTVWACVPQWVARGVCWDNAMTESFFSALKNECVYRTVYATKAQPRRDLITYIEEFYNSRRRHSALDYRRPNEVHYSYEQPALTV